MTSPLNVLKIDASGRFDGSTSRGLTDALIEKLRDRHGALRVNSRDLTASLPHVDQSWIYANFTEPTERTGEQEQALALSDALVSELTQADVVVIGVPIYNFGIPAALKAWIDMIARARLTFRHTENGPRGLLEGKTAYLAVASGGTEIGSAIDFATPYMRHVLSFLGITDVHIVSAGQQMARGGESVADAKQQLDRLFDNSGLAAADAA